MPLPHTSDCSELTALRQGSEQALNAIMERWEAPLLAFAWRYLQNTSDAQDLVAETFVRLYQQRNKLREDTKLSSWLFTVLTHLCHNHHRWRKRHPSFSLEETASNSEHKALDSLADKNPGAPEVMENLERVHLLEQAMEQLPHDLKTALFLHHYEEMSYREIAHICGCSERGVETRIYRAKQKLRELLFEPSPGREPRGEGPQLRPLKRSS